MKKIFTKKLWFLMLLMSGAIISHAQTPYVHYTFDTNGSDGQGNVDLTVGPNVTFVLDPDRGLVAETTIADAASDVTLDVNGSWFSPTTTEYTISTWFRYEDRNSWFGAIYAYGLSTDFANTYTYFSPASGGGESRLGLVDNAAGYTDGAFVFVRLPAAGGGPLPGSGNNMLADNDYSNSQWHHVAVTQVGTNVKVYLDGAIFAENNVSLSIADQISQGIDTYKIGRNVHNTNQRMSARYDDFKVFHTALSPIQMAQDAGTEITYVSSFSATPDATSAVIVNGTYAEDADLEVASLLVEPGSAFTVKSGRTLTVGSYLEVAGTLVVESGASLITNGDVVGDVTIERNTTFDANTGQYSIVGSPVAAATTAALGSSALVYAFDEQATDVSDGSVNRFTAMMAGTPMAPGVGYFSAFTGDGAGAVSFTGTPNSGNIDVPVTQSVDGFNLLANPYPAAIDVATFIADADNDELTGSIYLWDDNNTPGTRGSNADYITVNSSGVIDFDSEAGGNTFDGKIRSVQGFFVEASTAGTVTFKEAHISSGSNDDASFFRKAPSIDFTRFELTLSNNEFYSETLLAFREEATQGVDRLYDAKKFVGENSVQIYSLIDQKPFAIQTLPTLNEAITLPIGVEVEFAGVYDISIQSIENMPEGYIALLVDEELNISYDLSQGASLSLSSGKYDDRFSISLSKENVLSNSKQIENFNIYSSNGQTQIWLPNREGVEVAKIETFDLLGKKLNTSLVETSNGNWKGTLTNGNGIFFMVISMSDGSVFTTKFLDK